MEGEAKVKSLEPLTTKKAAKKERKSKPVKLSKLKTQPILAKKCGGGVETVHGQDKVNNNQS